MTARGTAVSVRGLGRRFGATTAVDGISFDVGEGELFGFLGPNGAGKSTTIGMLCTLLAPTSGTALVAGHDIVTERYAVRRGIGLVFQDSVLDGQLTAAQNLRFHGELYGMPRGAIRARVAEVLEMVGLEDRGDVVAASFSGGMKRRLEIARGLLHSPRVLFLDEPTAGLDPVSRRGAWEHLARLRETQGVTVFMTTHYLEEAENCDRIAIIDRGRIAALGSPDTLKAEIGRDRVRVRTEHADALVGVLRERFGLPGRTADGAVEFTVADGSGFVPRLLAEARVPVTSVDVARPSLDDVFLRHTGAEHPIATNGAPP